MSTFVAGQRWMSTTEPELGLGSVTDLGEHTVTLSFTASDERREYAVATAPLQRVRFAVGEQVVDRDGRRLAVTAVVEKGGLLVYHADRACIPESQLADDLGCHRPSERLRAGRIDHSVDFSLRVEAMEHRARIRRWSVRGLVGARIAPVAHQLYVASEVASRHAPRVLLADEVGLGKTIEAGLILHRLILAGQVNRALVLVPDILVHQWFVEMLRRFNLRFTVLDEARYEALDREDPERNPFTAAQLIVARLPFLTNSDERRDQAVAAGWDLLVIDEAHHLRWTPTGADPAYECVVVLADAVPGLLLLTAVPEQLGSEGHFGRLHLLDANRFPDFDQFLEEQRTYRDVAAVVRRLEMNEPLSDADVDAVNAFLGADALSPACLRAPDLARKALVRQLIDHHGTSRVMFRNSRRAVKGFPRRLPRPAPLPCPPALKRRWRRQAAELDDETLAAGLKTGALTRRLDEADPRIDWLVELLQRSAPEKVLLICRRRELAAGLDVAIRDRINVRTTRFHEAMSLIAQDRSAAYFAEAGGAQIMLCSEVGSEGRNFQFAHEVVLFDLPWGPDLLEQRIGRLDRIGQEGDVLIHIPYLQDTDQEVLYEWYAALDAFAHPLRGGHRLVEALGDELAACTVAFARGAPGRRRQLSKLCRDSTAAGRDTARRLEEGRDLLVEKHSCDPAAARGLVRAIRERDRDAALEDFMSRIFEHYGLQVEELASHVYALSPGGRLFTDAFPGLPERGLTVTFSRRLALQREEWGFLTWDHPMVIGALELFLASDHGNCSFAMWPAPDARSLLLEAVFVLECLAPPALQADRFLPPVPVRVLLDHRGRDLSDEWPSDKLASRLRPAALPPFLRQPKVTQVLLPELLRQAEGCAAKQATQRRQEAEQAMQDLLGAECNRLRLLRQRNPSVRAGEIEQLEQQRTALSSRLAAARLRLDAVRVIWRGSEPQAAAGEVE